MPILMLKSNMVWQPDNLRGAHVETAASPLGRKFASLGDELLLRGRRTLHAAFANRFTVSLHCPCQSSATVTSRGQLRERQTGGPTRKAKRCPGLTPLICSSNWSAS